MDQGPAFIIGAALGAMAIIVVALVIEKDGVIVTTPKSWECVEVTAEGSDTKCLQYKRIKSDG